MLRTDVRALVVALGVSETISALPRTWKATLTTLLKVEGVGLIAADRKKFGNILMVVFCGSQIRVYCSNRAVLQLTEAFQRWSEM